MIGLLAIPERACCCGDVPAPQPPKHIVKAADGTGVAQLIQAVKQHQKFKQLASYSIQCLAKAIIPPTVGWEANMKEAYHAGALEAITEVWQGFLANQPAALTLGCVVCVHRCSARLPELTGLRLVCVNG